MEGLAGRAFWEERTAGFCSKGGCRWAANGVPTHLCLLQRRRLARFATLCLLLCPLILATCPGSCPPVSRVPQLLCCSPMASRFGLASLSLSRPTPLGPSPALFPAFSPSPLLNLFSLPERAFFRLPRALPSPLSRQKYAIRSPGPQYSPFSAHFNLSTRLSNPPSRILSCTPIFHHTHRSSLPVFDPRHPPPTNLLILLLCFATPSPSLALSQPTPPRHTSSPASCHLIFPPSSEHVRRPSSSLLPCHFQSAP
ncbi:unnamed protein product [Somion occarium]|uniref:Uncharacterized protein n=1 Tax=Somion occarium TaxID=3059160 RepID=A0ABP1CX09_9APHY